MSKFKKTKAVGKHLWKRKNIYGHIAGSVASGVTGFVAGAKTYAGVVNYNPQQKRELRKMRMENKKAFKNLRGTTNRGR